MTTDIIARIKELKEIREKRIKAKHPFDIHSIELNGRIWGMREMLDAVDDYADDLLIEYANQPVDKEWDGADVLYLIQERITKIREELEK